MDGAAAPTMDLVGQLVAGFEALSEEYRELSSRHQDIEAKLSVVKNQYTSLCFRFSNVPNPPQAYAFEDKLRATTQQYSNDSRDVIDLITAGSNNERNRGSVVRIAQEAVKTLQDHMKKNPDEGVRIWKGPSADQANPLPPISENQVSLGCVMERDFTTPGTPSRLGCPFASMAGKQLSSHAASVVSRYRSSPASKSSVSRFTPQGIRSRRQSIEDPIRAETCGMETLAEPSSPAASAAICPIRFLDQHKPEEIAQYFEKHKHELPRSHEICVKRYQSNAESIRQLDAKYGNLVSMIQGLGAKHQSMLPDTPPQECDGAGEQESAAKIQKWARRVSADLEKAPEKDDRDCEEEDRLPHFDRPLKDIRVGESPSRPWGITVPPKFDRSVSIASSKPAEIANAKEGGEEPNNDTSKSKAPQCPFREHLNNGHEDKHSPTSTPEIAGKENHARCGDTTQPQSQPQPLRLDGTSNSQPQMLFTGPVFIGYPMDQALAILQQGQRQA
ncbi:MAG: hypothetical protein Q9157_006706 [Trypethelium eluteriae]